MDGGGSEGGFSGLIEGRERWWKADMLLFGRMYLPTSTLEALYLKRMKPTTQFRITGVSDGRLKSGGTVCFFLPSPPFLA